MKAEYKKLGEYIQPVDVRNSDLKVSHLLGLSIEKCFIESIANTIGTDFRPYKIVKKRQFAYGPVTSRNGDKITIALLKEAEECIISSSYSVFEISDTKKLLPEYLMLWFSRPEFDRYARFKSHGSVREIFDWDEMCRVELLVPDIAVQQKIVDTYNAITRRIGLLQRINEKLERMGQVMFEEMFEEDLQKEELPFTDIIDLLCGGTPSTTVDSYWNGNIPFFAPADLDKSIFCFSTEKTITEDGLKNCSSKLYPENMTFITCRGTVGKLALAGVPMAMNQSCYALRDKNGKYPFFTYSFARFAVTKLKKKASGAVF
ncbi:MAG: restriction endonuclease subunit S, partial [Spirochaetales bacterium]|nr:restriction endonuclease subunit S [Spirochaetales bacterium]